MRGGDTIMLAGGAVSQLRLHPLNLVKLALAKGMRQLNFVVQFSMVLAPARTFLLLLMQVSAIIKRRKNNGNFNSTNMD